MSPHVASSPAGTLPTVDGSPGTPAHSSDRPGAAQALLAEARTLLDRAFGPAADRAIGTGRARGSVGIQADQTHYSDGFALVLGLPHAVAVALRRSSAASRVAFAPDATPVALHDAHSAPHRGVDVIRRTVASLRPPGEPGLSLDIAVVSSIPPVLGDAALSALAVATASALNDLYDVPADRRTDRRAQMDRDLARDVAVGSRRPTSVSYVLAAREVRPAAVLLVDTALHDHLPVTPGQGEPLGWAVLDPGGGPPAPPQLHRTRAEQAEAALDRLRRAGVADIDAFRDLEHRDLERAVDILPEELRPITRHLVTENRRVQKHVRALRHGDGQMIGGLLLMSHASRRSHLNASTDAIDAIVEEAEALTFDGGVYGAGLASRDGALLVTGRPPAFDRGLERLAEQFESRMGRSLGMYRL
jgi:galactokinase